MKLYRDVGCDSKMITKDNERVKGWIEKLKDIKRHVLSICQYLSRFGMPTIVASVLPDGCNINDSVRFL